MRIKKIEWRNFSSYGNRTQELSFEDSNLYQIVGENGAGKTSISQAISFALYGKVEGKKLSDIPNRINGNTWVRISVEASGNSIVIERGLEPSIFRVIINEVEYDKADKRSVQDYLTEDLLGIPQYVFNNTISLSINDFKSFIKMNPEDKRKIIDKIFGFHILNKMRAALKDEAKRIKEILTNTAGKLEALTTNIENSSAEMIKLSESLAKDNKGLSDGLSANLKTFADLQTLHNGKVSEFEDEYALFTTEMRNNNNLIVENEGTKREIDGKIALYKNDKCPTCQTELSGEFHKNIEDELIKERGNIAEILLTLNKEQKEFSTKDLAFGKTRVNLSDKSTKITSKLLLIKTELGKLGSVSSDKQVSSLKKIIDSFNVEHSGLSQEKFKTEEKIDWIKSMDEVIGEKGVKQMAIRTILPSLNSEILDLLNEMGLEYQIIFDEEFKASIYHMGLKVPTSTLSTGEMKKVDFIVLISILKLMKLKFSSINLLFLDELFSSVDPEGVNAILKILKKVSKDMGLSVFVINHAPMSHDIFDWKLEVTKPSNFSTITIEKF